MARPKRDLSREIFGKLLEEAERVWGPRVEQAIREAISVNGNGTNGFEVGEKEKEHELTPWEVLGVRKNDSPELIREVYLAKAKHYHPDKSGNSEKFIELKEAYDTIMAEVNKPTRVETVAREF
ncbi:MAG: J domain-containing protein [bacterium]|nr:J domain-containing protein [bacterium]